MSYEHQSPGITILTLLSVPPTGGDTGWASQTAAYSRLSKPIQTLLEGLRAEHSGFPQAENARRDGKFVRREPVKSEHPIVRVHPVSKHGFFGERGGTRPPRLAREPNATFLGHWREGALRQSRLHEEDHRSQRRGVGCSAQAVVQGKAPLHDVRRTLAQNTNRTLKHLAHITRPRLPGPGPLGTRHSHPLGQQGHCAYCHLRLQRPQSARGTPAWIQDYHSRR